MRRCRDVRGSLGARGMAAAACRLACAVLLAVAASLACPQARAAGAGEHAPAPVIAAPLVTRHLANIRQLTHGGANAEAYFSPDGGRLVFQSTRPPYACDQIFIMDVDGSHVRLVSGGEGRTTCGFFFPDARDIVFASTVAGGPECPPPPDRSKGYVWPVYPTYDIYRARADGGDRRRLTFTPGYNAECSVSSDGKRIVLTSDRDGDLEIYTMAADGSDVRRLTHEPGYDGGPFFSWDCRYIVYRSQRPSSLAEVIEYRKLLLSHLVKPSHAEIMVMRADGSDKRQITSNGAANWAPFMHPDDRTIVFSSNMHDPQRRTFSLYAIGVDGTGLERLTQAARFDAFAMFSRDGRKIVWCSTAGARDQGEFNIFIADWIP